ncbi:hypothetical protein [Allosphingosinicella sp.]|uniref:hypothetical protein n=1 Tax=Allosphingosinicella sp. TaxID=2823234 RepID=UPI0037846D05
MKPFTTLAAALFGLMAFAHLYRLVQGCEVVVSGTVIPQWVSVVGLVIAAVMSLMLWREARR